MICFRVWRKDAGHGRKKPVQVDIIKLSKNIRSEGASVPGPGPALLE